GQAGEAPRAQTRAPRDRIPREARAPQSPAPSDESPLRPGRALLAVAAAAVDPRGDDRLWLTVSSFTRPTALALGELDADGSLGRVEVLRRAPERFDAGGVVVTQHAAVSEDGTRVPYFQVGRPSAGPVATMLYGYGGFEVSRGVDYLPVVGKAWLERGGTFVVANIRGGGEYGPDWHRAGLRENRHRVYEDFAAVARALIGRGVTTPAQLAVHGGSNGGLLVGNMLTRHPELVGAVVCEVPLLDMSRYTHLLAGASWRAEYGDPDDPAQWEFIRTFSPFHLLEPGRDYPPVLLVTSTRDDRVHPAHARTMAHRMAALGQDVTYFENSEGGHGRASTNAQRALMSALVHEFAWRRLAPGRPD
ncbi:MAG: prolyl oligopeptidase family serine peptidase, partial [Actinomyces dentalis]